MEAILPISWNLHKENFKFTLHELSIFDKFEPLSFYTNVFIVCRNSYNDIKFHALFIAKSIKDNNIYLYGYEFNNELNTFDGKLLGIDLQQISDVRSSEDFTLPNVNSTFNSYSNLFYSPIFIFI